jgi:hypothetical protein
MDAEKQAAASEPGPKEKNGNDRRGKAAAR